MFKIHKNRFAELIDEAGFGVNQFVAYGTPRKGFVVKVKGQDFTFGIEPEGNLFYTVFRNRFLEGFPYEQLKEYSTYLDNDLTSFHIDNVFGAFKDWLSDDVYQYFLENDNPDIWAQIRQQVPILESVQTEDEHTNFSDEEKVSLRQSLNQYRQLIEKEFEPTPEMMAEVNKRLDYIDLALDRLNRFDWRGSLLNATISIATALTLSPDRGKILWDLAKQAFSNVHLLPF